MKKLLSITGIAALIAAIAGVFMAHRKNKTVN